MPTTIIGDDGNAFPDQFSYPIIELSMEASYPATEDDWTLAFPYIAISIELHASSSSIDSFHFSARYGNKVKQPYATGYTFSNNPDLTGFWIRVSLPGDQDSGDDPEVIFVGRIENQNTKPNGSVAADSGDQEWVAYGLLKLLQKFNMYQSYFSDGTNTCLADWIPPMNSRDMNNTFSGNAFNGGMGTSATLYGGTDVWSHYDYVDYLIQKFLNPNTPDGMIWSLDGQADILKNIKTTITFPQNSSMANLLRLLIPTKYGLDYWIAPTDDGFAIRVFALADSSQTFGSASIPANPNKVAIISDEDDIDNFATEVVLSGERRYDKVVMMGKRIVVCGSLAGANANWDSAPGSTKGSLVGKWSIALEALYKSAESTTDPDAADAIREKEKYREVYQHFGVPVTWDYGGGTWAVQCDANGKVTNKTGGSPAKKIDFQVSFRNTLPYVPLKEGFDYSTNPPTDNTLGAGTEADVKPIMAWAYNSTPELGDPRNMSCEHLGIGIHKPFHDFGLFLSASPNHKLALNAWTDAQLATTNLNSDQMVDWKTLIATIAIESDHRLMLSYTLPDNLAAGDGSVYTVLDEESECWVLLPNTAVDVDANGKIIDSGKKMIVLRNDTDRLSLAMAGEVSRYINDRSRAALQFKGWKKFASLRGQILTVTQNGKNVTKVGSPITSVIYSLNKFPTTILKAGYS